MIEKILKKQIPNLLNNADFWQQEKLPISKSRLWALYHNPESDDDDVVLYYFKKNGIIESYLCIYHFWWNYQEKSIKLGAASAWYSSDQAKGMGFFIMREALQDLDGNFISHMFNYHVKELYDASREFQTIQEMTGFTYTFQHDGFFKTKNNKKLESEIQQKLVSDQIEIEYVNYVDDELYTFIQKNSANHFYPKSKDYFNWLLNYRWVLESPVQEIEVKNKYFFSTTVSNYGLYAIKILKKGTLDGFLIFSVFESKLKIYLYYAQDEIKLTSIVKKLVSLFVLRLKCKEVHCYDNILNHTFVQDRFYKNYTQSKKLSIMHKKFEIENLKNCHLNYGDGDCIFT